MLRVFLVFFADLALAAPENQHSLPILAVQLDAPKSQLPQDRPFKNLLMYSPSPQRSCQVKAVVAELSRDAEEKEKAGLVV